MSLFPKLPNNQDLASAFPPVYDHSNQPYIADNHRSRSSNYYSTGSLSEQNKKKGYTPPPSVNKYQQSLMDRFPPVNDDDSVSAVRSNTTNDCSRNNSYRNSSDSNKSAVNPLQEMMNANGSNSYDSNNAATSWERLQQTQRQAYYQIDHNAFLDKQYSNRSLESVSSSNSIGVSYTHSSSSTSIFSTVEVASTPHTESKPSTSPAPLSGPPSSSQPSTQPSSPTPNETVEEPEETEEKNDSSDDDSSENEDEELTEVVSELSSSGLLERKKTVVTAEPLEQEMNRKIQEFKRLQKARNELVRQLGENAARSAEEVIRLDKELQRYRDYLNQFLSIFCESVSEEKLKEREEKRTKRAMDLLEKKKKREKRREEKKKRNEENRKRKEKERQDKRNNKNAKYNCFHKQI